MLDDLDIRLAVDASGLVTAMPQVEQLRLGVSRLNTETKALAGTPLKLNMTDGKTAVGQLGQLRQSLDAIGTVASETQFHLGGLSKSLSVAAVSAKPLTLLGNNLNLIGGSFRLASSGASHLASAIGLASTVATYLASGLALIIAPLSGLVIIPKMVAAAFSLMWAAVTVPFRMAWGAISLFVKGVVAAAKPVIAMAAAFFRLKVALSGLHIQFALVGKLLSIMPPKLRAIFIGLVALGAAGRAGRVAMGLLSAGIGALNASANLLKTVVGGLTGRIRMLVSGLKGLSIQAAGAALWVGNLARSAAGAALGGLASLSRSALSAAANLGSALAGKALFAVKALGLLAVAATGWGVSLAADAEQAETAFGTLLGSANNAKAVLLELEEFAASTPFQLTDLRDGSKQLLNAQVPARDLTAELRKLGDIAAGTGKPIGDFVSIFAKIKSTGKVGLEQLNQLATRGVPIYTALQQQLGVSREEMLKMISAGKVGFYDLNGALTGLTAEGGVFAGGMAAQSQTLSGLWSTLKDNVSFAVRELGINVAEAFDFKGLMAGGIELFQSLRAGIASAMPVFTAIANVVRAAFGAVWEVVSVTFSSIASALGMTGGDWMQSFVEWAAVATWAFKNWPDIAQLAFTNVALWLVQTGAEFMHLFTGVIPALLSWFGRNWADVFTDIWEFTRTVFTNMWTNVKSTMSAIWNWIKTGGAASLADAWTPLTEGFKSSLEELEIPPRILGPLERSLQAESDRLGSALSGSLSDEIAAGLKDLADFRTVQANATKPVLTDPNLPDPQANDNGLTASTGGRRETAVESINRGSVEALRTIFNAQGDKTGQKQLAEQKKGNAFLKQIAANSQPTFVVAGPA